jgi:hypothetical protein
MPHSSYDRVPPDCRVKKEGSSRRWSDCSSGIPTRVGSGFLPALALLKCARPRLSKSSSSAVADPEPERPVPPVGPPGRRPPGSRPGPSLPTRRRPARGSAGPAGAAAADHRRMPTPVGSNRAGSPSRWPASGRCATLRTPASTETGRRRARPRDPLGRRDSWCGTAA